MRKERNGEGFKLFLKTEPKSAPGSIKSKLFPCLTPDTIDLDPHLNENQIERSHIIP